MFVVAVTGGLGAGKSEAARFFERCGAVVLDLDELAKSLLDADPVVHEAVVAAFGESILDTDGIVVRSRLADEAFRCDATAATLSAAVHPSVVRKVEAELARLVASDNPPAVVVIEVPLLAEAPALLSLTDLVVTLEASESVRLARVIERGMAADDAKRRMARQADDGARREIADVAVNNDGSVEDLSVALGTVWEEHVGEARGGTGGD